MSETFDDLSLKVRNHKCFGEREQGFDRVLPINIIIGRNNSGKSALLDLLAFVAPCHPNARPTELTRPTTVLFSRPLEQLEILNVFTKICPNAAMPAEYHEMEKAQLAWEMTQGEDDHRFRFVELQPPTFEVGGRPFTEFIVQTRGNPLSGVTLKRLISDRDLLPEEDRAEIAVASNGNGATNCIQHFINKDSLPRDLVERTLLDELNKIFQPDSSFSRIHVQQMKDAKWEVFLDEINKGQVRLSHSGSGLKTVLLVLIFLYLLPHQEGTGKDEPMEDYAFAFEELENNLHPALQRRLLCYLRDFTLSRGNHLFISTHSSVAVDLFSREEKAQIIHVTHDGRTAEAHAVITYRHKRSVLDDLDVRASDLLQSNGVVWVEGPSDRLYLNRWIELWTGGEIKEGIHYQCVSYGGKLLTHLSGKDPEAGSGNEFSVFRVNRNAIVLMDSDRGGENDDINDTKKRITSEIESNDGLGWVTQGREVENYIPQQALKALYGADISALGPEEQISEFLERTKPGEAKRFERDKVSFAARVCEHVTRDGMEETLDLGEKLTKVCERIYSWNGMDPKLPRIDSPREAELLSSRPSPAESDG
jgi:hypothetical protein